MAKIWSSIKLSFSRVNRNIWLFGIGGLLLFSFLLSFGWFYYQYFSTRFVDNVYLDDVRLSGLTRDEAQTELAQKLFTSQADWTQTRLTLISQDHQVSASLAELGITSNFQVQLEKAWAIGHQGNIWQRISELLSSHWQSQRFYTQFNYDWSKIQPLLQSLSGFDSSGRIAQATLATSGKIETLTIDRGEAGVVLDVEGSQQLIENTLQKNIKNLSLSDFSITLPTNTNGMPLSSDAEQAAKERAKKFVGKELIYQYNYKNYQLTDKQLIALLRFPTKNNEKSLDEMTIQQIIQDWAKTIDQAAVNARFTYDPQTLVVTSFQADQPATILDQEQTFNRILQDITTIENNSTSTTSSDLPVKEQAADIPLAQTNNLGINEVIGFGESWYAHSIPARIHNVALTANKLNNVIVAPGAEFSFNKALGEVSTETEYKAAYIIQNGQTILAPGGGVCQVSSTLFRALLNAGLKISRRLPHSYRVSYYEINNEPGFDATVYSGNTDLRFVNDTDHYLLLHFETDSTNLYMNVKIYGTSDGRSTEIINYRKWDYRPAAAPVYLTDPSLAPGEMKQIDWAATGIKAEFTNVVRDKNGNVMHEDYYYSNYQPWSAKYLVGP